MMDNQSIDRCCISDEEAHRIMQDYMERLNKKLNELINERECAIKEKNENLKKQNEALEHLAFPGVIPAPVPSYGDKLLPCCCECTDTNFMKDIVTNTDSEG